VIAGKNKGTSGLCFVQIFIYYLHKRVWERFDDNNPVPGDSPAKFLHGIPVGNKNSLKSHDEGKQGNSNERKHNKENIKYCIKAN